MSRAAQLGPALILDVLITPRIASLALLAACLIGLAYLSFDARFYIYAPDVVGHHYVEAGDVVAASGLEGLHVAWVQPEQVARMILKRLPDLRAAQVACELPARCTIAVEERQPLFVWRQGDTGAWIDAGGVAFTMHGTAGLPVVDMPPGLAPLPGTQVDRDLVAGVQALREALPELTALRYTTERGLEFSDPAGGWPVYLGSGPAMETRVAVWRALSDDLARRGVRPTFVDVRYARAPYYSTR